MVAVAAQFAVVVEQFGAVDFTPAQYRRAVVVEAVGKVVAPLGMVAAVTMAVATTAAARMAVGTMEVGTTVAATTAVAGMDR